MTFPNGKQFALTIVDDTDGDLISNTQSIYEFLAKLGFRTTKTVWALPPKDSFKGLSLQDYHYRQYIKKLQRKGFEVALHNVGSGKMTRQDSLDGLEIFKQFIGSYPKVQANHAQNPDNIYWGIKRFSLLRPFWAFSRFKGDNPESIYFWGDYHQKYVKYTRNFTFRQLNTLKADPYMPYKDSTKKFANFWFSASDGGNLKKFLRLTGPENIEKLKNDGGASIIYTHFASGFTNSGRLDRAFQRQLAYISRENGWFVPVGALLDYLIKHDIQHVRGQDITLSQKLLSELKWLFDKVL